MTEQTKIGEIDRLVKKLVREASARRIREMSEYYQRIWPHPKLTDISPYDYSKKNILSNHT